MVNGLRQIVKMLMPLKDGSNMIVHNLITFNLISMKNLALGIILFAFSIPSYGWIELCPTGSESGSHGCYKVDEVYMFGEWFMACCANTEAPTGYECVDDNCYSKNYVSGIPELTKQNAYILFAQGYRAWTIVEGKAHDRLYLSGFDLETIRAYLPVARKFFLKNPDLEMFSLTHDDNITIVIKKPEKKEDLQEEIIFPQKVSGKELENYLKKLDDKMLKVYPNPVVSDFVTISFQNKIWISKIEIIAIDGKSLKCIDFTGGTPEAKINLKDLDGGNYIIKIIDKSGREFSRQIKKE